MHAKQTALAFLALAVAFIALACMPMPFLFFKYGPRIRQGSKFAPCIDLKIKAAIEAEKAAETATGSEKV